MLFALVLLPFAAALAIALLPNDRRRTVAACAGATMLGGLVLLAAIAPQVFAGEVLRASVDWWPAVPFVVRIDGLAWTFALLVYGIGALVVLYAAYYLSPDEPQARFFAFLLAFAGAMLGVVTAGNLVLLVVFWEATGLASFLLIGFWSDKPAARRGARMAFAITGAGGLALLAGVLLLGRIAGGYDLDTVLAAGPMLRDDPRFPAALLLILAGAFTKSAQFPFHFWLPHAMAAPTPVSAYLHSATMVKCGVFLLARLYPALGDNELWFWVVTLTGLATLVVGAVAALFQQDMKGLLAYSTISHLGLITLLFGLDEKLAVVAAVFHILNHATFKASLFMAAGIIDHEAGSRDFRKLNGLMRLMPVTGALAIVATAAMAGVPLLNGFLSKEMFFAGTLTAQERGGALWIVPALATIAGAFSVAYSIRFVHDVFFNGTPVGLPRVPHEPSRWMRVPVEVLVVVCLAVGIVPAATIGPLLALAAAPAVGGELPSYSLALWHGVNAALVMSGVATAAGIALYAGLHRWIDLHSIAEPPAFGRRAYERLVEALVGVGRAVLRVEPGGRLAPQLAWLFAAFALALAWPFLPGGLPAFPPVGATDAPTQPWTGGLVSVLAVATALAATACHRQRLVAIVLVGATGLAVSLAFVLLAAPDLALTQILVEVASVVLMMLALPLLPAASPREGRPLRAWRDAGIAVAVGASAAALAWAIVGRPFDSISPYFLENTVPLGGGTNAVNVILVDFRAFDTLGEITVLGVAALVVLALLSRLAIDAPARPQPSSGSPLIVATVAQLMLPFALMVSIYLFLRGHNLPGGGFIAGLLFAMAFIVVRIAGLGPPVSDALALPHPRWIALGIAVAAATGLGSLLAGHPFLTSTYGHPVLPVVGEVPLASAALFDLGVFLAVVGAVMLAPMALALARRGRLEGDGVAGPRVDAGADR